MSTRLRSTIFAGAAFAALGLAPQAVAQDFTNPPFGQVFKVFDLTGGMQPTVADIGVLCGFSPVAAVTFNIKPNSSILNKTTTENVLGLGVDFSAEVVINDDDSVNIEDTSPDPGSSVLSDQQIDGVGNSPAYDAVMAKGGNDIIVICAFQREFINNVGLPGKVQDLTVVWGGGVCPAAEDFLFPGACEAFNFGVDCDPQGNPRSVPDAESALAVHGLAGLAIGEGSALSLCGFKPFAFTRCFGLGGFVGSCADANDLFAGAQSLQEINVSSSPQGIFLCTSVTGGGLSLFSSCAR